MCGEYQKLQHAQYKQSQHHHMLCSNSRNNCNPWNKTFLPSSKSILWYSMPVTVVIQCLVRIITTSLHVLFQQSHQLDPQVQNCFTSFKVYSVIFNAYNNSHIMLSTNSHNIITCFVPIVTTIDKKHFFLNQSLSYDIQCL